MNKTAVVWIEYESESKPSIHTYEYAIVGCDEFPTLRDFLDSIKNLGKKCGYSTIIKNVVVA